MDSPLLPTRELGQTGLRISALGLGTVKLGRNEQIKYPSFDLPSDSQAQELFDCALGLGINLIDTAPAYGSAEERLGQLLGRRPFVIITKTGEEFEKGLSRYDFSKEHTLRSVERSLKRLRVSTLDCVLAHCPKNDLTVITESEVLPALQQLKERGDIRSFGASTSTVEAGLAAIASVDVLMLAYNASDQSQTPVMIRAAQLGKGILIKKAFGSGRLLASGGEDPVRACARHVFGMQGITSLIAGTINPKHLVANANAVREVLLPELK